MNRTDFSAEEALEKVYRGIEVIHRLPARAAFPQGNLHIGSIDFGPKVLRAATHTEPEEISGASQAIYKRIEDMRQEVLEENERIGLILSTYFLHNFAKYGQQDAFVQNVHDCFPEAALVIVDYTMHGLERERIKQLMSSKAEVEQMTRKGEDRFIDEHSCFSLGDLESTMAHAYRHIQSARLALGRSMVIGSDRELLQASGKTLQQIVDRK